MRSPLGTLLNKTPVSYAPSRGFSFARPERNDANAQMAAMGAVSTLFSIVNRISTAVASAEWRLYRTHDGRGRVAGEQDRKEVIGHLALDVWEQPNQFMTGQEFREVVQQHVDLTGEGWWVVGSLARMRGVPAELWPVRPDRMTPIPSPTEFLSGYVYTDLDGVKVPLGLDEVIQLRMPNPRDPYRGMGPVQALLADLDSAKYSAEWNRNFFLNSAEPGGIIQLETNLDDTEFKRMQMRWNEQHRGVAKAHKVAILEQGKWVDRAFSQRDMQFVELRNLSRDIMYEAYGISRATLGVTDGVNFAAAKAAKAQFAELLTVPRLERMKQALNREFLPLFGDTSRGVEFDYISPAVADEEAANAERDSKAGAAKTLIDAGFDPVDVLDVLGLPPMKHKPKPVPVAPAPPVAPGQEAPA